MTKGIPGLAQAAGGGAGGRGGEVHALAAWICMRKGMHQLETGFAPILIDDQADAA
jgi:hypothetical protein